MNLPELYRSAAKILRGQPRLAVGCFKEKMSDQPVYCMVGALDNVLLEADPLGFEASTAYDNDVLNPIAEVLGAQNPWLQIDRDTPFGVITYWNDRMGMPETAADALEAAADALEVQAAENLERLLVSA